MDSQWARRRLLVAGASGLAAGGVWFSGLFRSSDGDGGGGLFGSSDDSEQPDARFGFTYAPEGGEAVTIEYVSGEEIGSDLVVRTGDGDSVSWRELGSASVGDDEVLTPGSSVRIGPEVENWPDAIQPGETVEVVHDPEDGETAVLDTFEVPSPTPTPTPTPTPRPTPKPITELITGFEDNNLIEWGLPEAPGKASSASWTVSADWALSGVYAARYRGIKKRVVASVSGLGTYPSRGDTVVFHFHKEEETATTGIGFGVQTEKFNRGYRVEVRNAERYNYPDTAALVRWDGPENKTVLDRVDYDSSEYTGGILRWEVEWGDPTIRVHAFHRDDRILTLEADDTTYDDGGIALAANSIDEGVVYVDQIGLADTEET